LRLLPLPNFNFFARLLMQIGIAKMYL